MKVEVLMNGTTKLVLVPENEIERSILQSVGKTEVTVNFIDKGTGILDKVIPEVLLISPKSAVEHGS